MHLRPSKSAASGGGARLQSLLLLAAHPFAARPILRRVMVNTFLPAAHDPDETHEGVLYGMLLEHKLCDMDKCPFVARSAGENGGRRRRGEDAAKGGVDKGKRREGEDSRGRRDKEKREEPRRGGAGGRERAGYLRLTRALREKPDSNPWYQEAYFFVRYSRPTPSASQPCLP